LQEAEVELREQLKDFIRHKKWEQADDLWLQVVEGERRSAAFHQSVARFLLNKKEIGKLQEFYNLLLSTRNDNGDHAAVIDVAEALLDLEPTLGFLRPQLIRAVEGLHKDRDPERLKEILLISGLDGEAPDLGKALARVDELLGASLGQVFKHQQWGLGVVQQLDAQAGWAILDFPKKPNHRMTLEGLKNFLTKVPNDHILARIAKDAEGLKKEMKSDACGGLRLVLKSMGGTAKAAEIKRLLMDRFLDEKEYKSWWNKAREEARLDPYIDIKGTGASLVMILRREPRSFVDEIRVRLLEAKSVEERRSVLKDVAKHGDNADFSADDRTALYALFCKPIEDGRLTNDQERLGHGLLYQEYQDLFGEDCCNPIDVDELIRKSPLDAVEWITSLPVFELQRVGMEHLLEAHPERAAELLAEGFFRADSKLLKWMEDHADKKGHEDVFDQCIERILARPERNPEVFAWAARATLDGKFPHVTESVPRIEILTQVLTVLDSMEQEARIDGDSVAARRTVPGLTRLKAIIQDGHNKYVKAILKEAKPDEARRFQARLNYMPSLTVQVRSAIEMIMAGMHPDLKKTTRAEDEEEKRKASFHYATADAVERKRRELSNLVQVEIPKTSEAIGIARELGDLKENAEYHAAKDRQKLLMQQAKELEDLIGRARIIDLKTVRTDSVRFGTRVRLKQIATGTEQEHALLGMWEADGDKGIISYLTPFGSQLMNRTIGEVFTVSTPDGRNEEYEVLAIEAIAESPAVS
jgi:transcription elongation factor GreA